MCERRALREANRAINKNDYKRLPLRLIRAWWRIVREWAGRGEER